MSNTTFKQLYPYVVEDNMFCVWYKPYRQEVQKYQYVVLLEISETGPDTYNVIDTWQNKPIVFGVYRSLSRLQLTTRRLTDG